MGGEICKTYAANACPEGLSNECAKVEPRTGSLPMFGANVALIGQNSMSIGPELAESHRWHKLVELGPTSANTWPTLGQFWPEIGQVWRRAGQC